MTDDILYNRPSYCDKASYIETRKKIFARLNEIRRRNNDMEKRKGFYNVNYGGFYEEMDSIGAACEFNMAELMERLKTAFPNAKIKPRICQMGYLVEDKWIPAGRQRLAIGIEDKRKRYDGYEYIERTSIYDPDYLHLTDTQVAYFGEHPEFLSNQTISPYKIDYKKSTVMPDIDRYGGDVEDLLMDMLLENYNSMTQEKSYIGGKKGKINQEGLQTYKGLREQSATLVNSNGKLSQALYETCTALGRKADEPAANTKCLTIKAN